MKRPSISIMRGFPLVSVIALSAACTDGFDIDLRPAHNSLSTAAAAQNSRTENRPDPDSRGVISYPTYQVALAKRGDTVADVATRIGVPAAELARYNGIDANTPLRRDELLALPKRVQEPATGVIQPNSQIDIQTLAGDAIDRSAGQTSLGGRTPSNVSTRQLPSGAEPVRHRVERGETAYSIARLYQVSVRSLADWNGLGADLSVREGQHLLIPVKVQTRPAPKTVSEPGAGSTTPTPPSASKPLPDEKPSEAKPPKPPASPNLKDQRTSASSAKMSLPVQGKITSLFDADKAGYILVSAKPGESVKAAAAGTVRLVSKDVEGEEIVVIDHGNGTQTAYSFIKGINVKKGQKVKRGQQIASATKNQYNAVQFLVFNGTDPVDPMPYLN